jgi:hypothetical protein
MPFIKDTLVGLRLPATMEGIVAFNHPERTVIPGIIRRASPGSKPADVIPAVGPIPKTKERSGFVRIAMRGI